MFEKINQIANHIKTLTKREFNQYLIVILVAVSIPIIGISYYIYHSSSTLVKEIKKLNSDENKIRSLFAQNERLQQEEEKIKSLFKKYPNFTMSSFFERFHTKNKITPEPNWKPEEGAIIQGTEEGTKYQEIELRATFKNQAMQKLVSVLQDLYKDPIVYLKALEITEAKGRINFELVLATKQYKKETEAL
jgi:hypothetical protein